jgi:hypothetical protein
MISNSSARKHTQRQIDAIANAKKSYCAYLSSKVHWVRSMAYFAPIHVINSGVERFALGLETDELLISRLVTVASLALGADYLIEKADKKGKEVLDTSGSLEGTKHRKDFATAGIFAVPTFASATAIYAGVVGLPIEQAVAGGLFSTAVSFPRNFFLNKSKKLFYGLHLGLKDAYCWMQTYSEKQLRNARMATYGALLSVTVASYTAPASSWSWLIDQIERRTENIDFIGDAPLEEQVKKSFMQP